MKRIIIIMAAAVLGSCAPRSGYVLQHDVATDTLPQAEPFDTLAAYRKRPGQPKNVEVRGHYRKDSTYVKPHRRSTKG